MRERPEWWPPKVGDKLRHDTIHGTADGKVKRVGALLHVLSVFEDMDGNGEQRIVTAEWFPTRRRWNYEVFWWFQAAIGTVWPDGREQPQ